MYTKNKVFSLFTALVMIFAMVGVMPIETIAYDANTAAAINKACDWAVAICNDNSHGYGTQGNINGPDYACTTLIAAAYTYAGIPFTTDYTCGDWDSKLPACGFERVDFNTSSSAELQRGDIVWNGGHVELYIGDNQLASANSNRGYPQVGDQTGTEVHVHKYYSGVSGVNWKCAFRLNGSQLGNDDELGIPYPRPSGSPLLSTGSKGSGVSWLQTALNKANNAGLAVDGDFGSGTKQAVINFQKANGLDADGIAGPATINKLVEVIKGGMVHKPTWAWISATDDRTSFEVGEQIHFWFSADETSSPITHYTIGINKGSERIITEDCGSDYYVSFDEPGEYSVYVSAYNSAGWADSNVIYFYVYDNLKKPTITTNKETYTVNDNVEISWESSSSNPNLSHYWLTIIAPDGSFVIDQGLNIETVSYNFIATSIGEYTIKTFATPTGSVSGERSTFDVKTINVYDYDNLTKPTITTNKKSYTVNDNVEISWESSSLNPNLSHYWLTIIAPDGSFVIDQRLNIETVSYNFIATSIGEYTIKTFATPTGSVSGERSVFDIKTINVYDYDNLTKPTITTNKEAYTINDNVEISWKPSPENSNLSHYWLVVKDSNGKEIIGETMGKNTSHSFSVSKTGEYTIIVYATPLGSSSGEGSLTDTKTIYVSMKGDLNSDGKSSAADAVKLKSWLTSVPNSKLENKEAADLNSDGKINVFDLCILKRMLIKK